MNSVFNWSGGKDSALCLHHVLQDNRYTVATLATTLGSATRRVTMHGVRQELLQLQAQSLSLPLLPIMLPENAGIEAYNEQMGLAMRSLKDKGITHAIFGDINLEDLRQYREQQLSQYGMEAVFPLWGRSTHDLVREFIQLGYKAVVVCVNARLLDRSFAGRLLDETFLQDLPAGVDPAGENGEYHTFVFDGPIFSQPIRYSIGETVLKKYGAPADQDDNCFADEQPSYDTGFWFCDLLPA